MQEIRVGMQEIMLGMGGMRGMQRMIGMQGIRVGMWGIRVGMQEILVGKNKVGVREYFCNGFFMKTDL